MIDLDAALAFIGFVEARHQVWEKRQAGLPQPWTDDPIIASRKFTNVFRILDYGSQFLFDGILDDESSARDTLMRCFLYRHTGRPEVWQYLDIMLGHYPEVQDLDETLEIFKEYRGETKVHLKSPRKPGQTGRGNGKQKIIGKRSIFTGAYLVFPQSQVPGTDKLESIIDLTKRLFTEGSPTDIVPDFLAAGTQAERFACLRHNRGVADFMSMQTLTDWGLSSQCGVDRENEFVVLGPGAIRGAKALDPTSKPYSTFEWAVNAIRSSPNCPRLELPDGRTRVPSYMDVQNTLCEFGKYVRFDSKPPAQQAYKPAHPGIQSTLVLPKHF